MYENIVQAPCMQVQDPVQHSIVLASCMADLPACATITRHTGHAASCCFCLLRGNKRAKGICFMRCAHRIKMGWVHFQLYLDLGVAHNRC